MGEYPIQDTFCDPETIQGGGLGEGGGGIQVQAGFCDPGHSIHGIIVSAIVLSIHIQADFCDPGHNIHGIIVSAIVLSIHI